jgi:hypothetical protein
MFQVAGSASIGSSYGNTSSPANGLIVEGNVGIGTTTPTSPLFVYKASGLNAEFSNGIVGAGSTGSIKIGDGTISKTYGSGWIWGSGMLPDGDNARGLGTNSARWGFIQIGNSLDSQISGMTFSTSGNIGIGTTTPTSKLEVFGTTTSTQIKITSGSSYGGQSVCYMADGSLGHQTSAQLATLTCVQN